MNQDPKQKLNEILRGMNASTLAKSKQDIDAFLHTPEGQKLAAALQGADRSKLMRAFLAMDTEEIRKKLASVDTGALSVEEILKNLR
ncbi:MAG: hypothetical protein E7397_03200 [Ruminococcaceae bacterium]|nr:hypothetical protein [Oscillospiraceae bacterium]